MTDAPLVEPAPYTTADDWNRLWSTVMTGIPPKVRGDHDISTGKIPHPTLGGVQVVSVRCTLPPTLRPANLVRHDGMERALAQRIGARALTVTPGQGRSVIVRFIPGARP